MTTDPAPSKSPKLSDYMCFNVYALNLALSRYYQAAFGDTGFTYPKFLVLLAVRDKGPLSLSDLAAELGAEANTLSPLVKKMSSFGLMERVRDPKDERRVLLSLKPYGALVLAEAQKVLEDSWDQLGADAEDVGKANAVMDQMRRKLDTLTPRRKLKIPDRPAEDS